MEEDTDADPVTASRRKLGTLAKIVISVVAGLVVLLVAWSVMIHFVVRAYLIPSESMAPTLMPKDQVYVNEFAYRFKSPSPGDVIVFTAPPNWSVGYKSIRSSNAVLRLLQNALELAGLAPPDENQLVKRIIAVGGQTVECRSSTGLTVDGQRLTEPYLDPSMTGGDPNVLPCLGPEFGPVTVPDGRLWVMGDNRTHSADSRAHCSSEPSDAQRAVLCTGDPTAGTVPVDNVVGRVWRNRA